MAVPTDLKYARSHEWARVDGDNVVVGISQYAQDQLGEVVYVELPEIGTGVTVAVELGTIEGWLQAEVFSFMGPGLVIGSAIAVGSGALIFGLAHSALLGVALALGQRRQRRRLSRRRVV